MENIDVAKYGFYLVKDKDGIKEYLCDLQDGLTAKLCVIESNYCLTYCFNNDIKTEKTVASRYDLYSNEDFEFILFRGRLGESFKIKNNIL